MKVKDVERTANVAWSPKNQSPILLAAGTAAQQLDASFNTNATLEIYSLNLGELGPDMVLKATATSEQRFYKIIWGAYESHGTIVGGCDGGLVQIYNASKLVNGENGLVCRQNKHTGPVHALDFNPFQQNLFATGAGESEIFIWDLNNTNTPMSPGSKSQPLEDVLAVSWNRQVQHILASTFASKCVIWDLRKNEPIIKLTDTVSRVRWKMIAWHPEVATQLCLASEEDHSPIIQLWDLRFATSPLKTLENHQRGVLSVAWCSDDPDLLVSCGKDNRIIAWNPNSNEPNGEVLSEIAKTNQWTFDVQWCPRNPAIIACPSFDGHVSIYSLMGGKTQQIQTTDKIADSFPGMEGYVQAPILQQSSAPVSVDLSRPPKWLKRPVGARFGFGGKLISFDNVDQLGHRTVQISQVITEPELVQKSTELEQALEYGNFSEYCSRKAETTNDQHTKYIWHFLRANFEDNPRSELLNLLGYRIEDVNNKLNQFVNRKKVDEVTNRLEDLKDPFDAIAEGKSTTTPFKIKTGDDTEGLITQALLLGNVEAAVELCLNAKRFADAIIIAMTGGSDLLARTQHAYLEQCEGYVSSLISALVSEDWASVINNCDLSSWKEALAATLTHSTDEALPLLCEQLGHRLEIESHGDVKLKQDSQLCYICAGSFDNLVNSWSGNARNSTTDLQDLVELVVFLQKAVERQGRQVQISGALADLLSHYASILASQGNLSTALSYLGSSQDEKVASLRDRLYISLGQKPAYGARQQSQSRRSSQRQSFSSFPNVGAQFNTPVSQAWQQQPQIGAFNQPTRTFSPAPPSQPPRPPSVGSNHGGSGSGLPSRKYVLDPSVTSNPYGAPTRNMYAPQPVSNFQNNNYPAPSPMTPLVSSNNNYVPNPVPMVPNPALNPTPLVPNMQPPPSMTSEMGQPATEKYFPTSAPGWNDPPPLNKPIRPQPKPEASLPSQPITHPLYGAAPTNNGYGNEPQMFQPQPTNNFPPSNNFAPPTTFNPTGFKSNAVSFNQVQNQSPAMAPEKPQPIQKPPIPEEHIHMQTVFDELKYQCSCAANNPQTKRKLEDVGRKLESLYDLLREQKLSPNTLSALHQMVQVVQNGDYTGGLNLHTQLVSGPDFAQIASFMPGLKVLLQCALQLQVYLR
ncbi:protein transport protein Sec31A [Tribolium madens]|uniref:protein transport protein Sec31A n=1 Tax=Tribolium madens TaxID=41895 RepID=UPI001CF71EFC|nr:protein transport protein Sec31A [Tribolium madens]